MAGAEASDKRLELKGALETAQSKLASAQERNGLLLAANEKLTKDNAQLTLQFSEQSGRVSHLNSQVNAGANCAFIHD